MNWNDRNGGNDFEIFQILGDYDPNWYVLDGLKPPANWQDPADSATFANALGRVSATALTHAKKGNLYEVSVANMTIFNHWQLHHLAIKNNWDAKFSGSWRESTQQDPSMTCLQHLIARLSQKTSIQTKRCGWAAQKWAKQSLEEWESLPRHAMTISLHVFQDSTTADKESKEEDQAQGQTVSPIMSYPKCRIV